MNYKTIRGTMFSSYICGPKKGRLDRNGCSLTSESVQSPALSLQGVDNVHGGDRLPLGVLGVGNGITDNVFQKHLKNTPGFLVDETRDSLDTSSASQTANSWLGDTLDVVSQNLPVTLSAPLSKTLSSFSSA